MYGVHETDVLLWSTANTICIALKAVHTLWVRTFRSVCGPGALRWLRDALCIQLVSFGGHMHNVDLADAEVTVIVVAGTLCYADEPSVRPLTMALSSLLLMASQQ